MNEQVFPSSYIHRILMPNKIQLWLIAYRKLTFILGQPHSLLHPWNFLYYIYYRYKYYFLSNATGFQIPPGYIGYGCRIGHWGSIVINGNGHIGNYCCLHNLVTFADGGKKIIGDRCFIGTGVTIAKEVEIGDDCKLSANSFINKTFKRDCVLIGGVPAKILKNCSSWVDEEPYRTEWEQCEKLRASMGL